MSSLKIKTHQTHLRNWKFWFQDFRKTSEFEELWLYTLIMEGMECTFIRLTKKVLECKHALLKQSFQMDYLKKTNRAKLRSLESLQTILQLKFWVHLQNIWRLKTFQWTCLRLRQRKWEWKWQRLWKRLQKQCMKKWSQVNWIPIFIPNVFYPAWTTFFRTMVFLWVNTGKKSKESWESKLSFNRKKSGSANDLSTHIYFHKLKLTLTQSFSKLIRSIFVKNIKSDQKIERFSIKKPLINLLQSKTI